MPAMSYESTIEFLYNRLPAFSRIGTAAYKADLHNTIALCKALGNPERAFKSIHIAGTNGKGSVSHMLAAIMQQSGFKTGLYTSPHLHDFRERFRINGQMVEKEWVVHFVEKIRPLLDEIEPSFFEITVAMAFTWFAEQEVDIAIIETGLGGRLDSTNVITPALSIITNIGWDHSNLLGDTLEKIANEKAGIIKANIPVVIGETLPETLPVFETTAHQHNAPLSIAHHNWQATDWRWEHHRLHVDVASAHETDHRHYELDLAGIYQSRNLLTVLEACAQLRKKGWVIGDDNIHSALKQVKKLTGFYGRWDVISHNPDIILDVAHNEPGIGEVLKQVELMNYQQLHIVLGVVKDKDPSRVLELLPRDAHYYFTQAHIPRAMSADELKQACLNFGLKGESYEDVNGAILHAKQNAGGNDIILVCGSIFLVAEVSA
ncbi:MAG: bifunctional folylpolyglutamate synthase/dihydrofolate synthase [Chitinophagaceae bacterium]|nr:bifunctional folylpolyglutamate synthase/dihydrofolate synthase [Chitinophagaceae bacterium]